MIFRKKYESNFTQVPNELLEHPQLSFKAKGIMCYLLSRPDDWEVSQRQMARTMKDGRDSIMSGFKELVAYGYLDGQYTMMRNGVPVWVWDVYDHPNF